MQDVLRVLNVHVSGCRLLVWKKVSSEPNALTVRWKRCQRDTIALSSTKAEFTAATDAGKAILYVRTILEELGLTQKDATVLHIDNNGALNMANQQQPTKRTRHIDIKQFVIQEWVERDLIFLRRITTTDNYADAFTKTLGRTLHYRHFDYIMGRIRPAYADIHTPDQFGQSITEE